MDYEILNKYASFCETSHTKLNDIHICMITTPFRVRLFGSSDIDEASAESDCIKQLNKHLAAMQIELY